MMNRNRYNLPLPTRRGPSAREGGGFAPGVTLPEMLVAVAITVAMLLMAGMIFKSATDASGKAMAHNEIMQQLRMITSQLDRDFAGLRPDLPMALIFQTVGTYPDSEGRDRWIRQDSVMFFANGDFQSLDGTVSGNLARIYYGLSADGYLSPAHEQYPETPDRHILCRRQKIIVSDDYYWSVEGWIGEAADAEQYDAYPAEYAPVGYWRGLDLDVFSDYLFNADLGNEVSFVRPTRTDQLWASYGPQGVQQQYFIPDMSEFMIEAWYEDMTGAFSWDPVPTYLNGGNSAYAFYWNVEDIEGVYPVSPTDWNVADQSWIPCAHPDPALPAMPWFSQEDLALGGYADGWPLALRFTFTLYDRHRRHYPEGLTFSYVVRLPERATR